MNTRDDICFIDGKDYPLSIVEGMGYDNFSLMVHDFSFKSLFKYYPNSRKYVKEERKYRNYSMEALKNNTVFLQDAKFFDDCFDCAVDLEWNQFLSDRVHKYCDLFGVKDKECTVNDSVYALSLKFYEMRTVEECIRSISFISDKAQRIYVENFLRRVFIGVSVDNLQWMPAIFDAIHKEYEGFQEILSKFRISCFSKSPYINRMWSSAYANNNQGFCIEYEIDMLTESGRRLYFNILPVIYSEQRSCFFDLCETCDMVPTIEDLWQMYFNGMLRKSVDWKDQEEWRLILCDGLIEQNPAPFFKIKKVYLGNKMPLKERKKIITYCRKNNIEYVGLKRQPDSYDLVECDGDCYDCLKGGGEKLMSFNNTQQH